MVKCAVIADDLTGANATGLCLKARLCNIYDRESCKSELSILETVNVLHSQQTAAV